MEKKSDSNVPIEVPKEIKEWNWGAFFLHVVWGIANKTYIALLAMVPIVNIFMMPVLGFKGNEWAWKNREWESVEQFMEVQRKWNIAGMIAVVIYLFVFLRGFWKIAFG